MHFKLLLLLTLAAANVHAAPYIDPAEDAQHFGSTEKLLFWTPAQQVAGYRNMEKLDPVRWIRAGDQPLELPERPLNLDGLRIGYHGRTLTLADYFKEQHVAGLLVLKDGAVVYERYGLSNGPATRWFSFSVTKSVVSMLVGAAIRDGYIGSVDEPVSRYLPQLAGSAYEQASIRNLLQMASGVAWDETYDDPDSDINQVDWSTLGLIEYLKQKPRVAAPGELHNYNTAETNLVGTLLRSAIGNNLSTYLEEKVWKPFGMEADANWKLTEPGGGEFGGCCISATLRDYGRIGLFAMQGGRLADGTEVLGPGWMAESTTPAPSAWYYGYQWWLTRDSSFRAAGIFGQGIYIVPDENVVIALHSARPHAVREKDWRLQYAMYDAVVAAVRRESADAAQP